MGIVIMLNSACLGAESELELQGEIPSWLSALEHVFLSVYIVEINLNLLARGRKESFSDYWFVFDFVLVVTSCTYSWIFRGMLSSFIGHGRGGILSWIVDKVLIFRLLRLLRLLRALRLVPVLRTAWSLTYGLLTSTNAMISTLALLVLSLYLFACLGIEIIAKDPIFAGDEIVKYRFGSLLSIMLTLVQFVTMDSISMLYVPLIKKKPVLALYFLII